MIAFAHCLPRLPSELDVLVIWKEKQQSCHDFRVWCSVVQEALDRLLTSSKYYQVNQVHPEDVLQQLPGNGEVSALTSLQLEGSTTDQSLFPLRKIYMELTFQASLCLASAQQQHTEQETVCQSIEEWHTGSAYTLMWPTIERIPINEFITDG